MLHRANPPRPLFFGLVPDPAVQRHIDAHRRRWYWPDGCRLPPPQRLHMTLFFLGEVQAAREADLCAALRQLEFEPFVMVLREPQVWRNGVAVLRPAPSAALDALHAQVGRLIGWAPGSSETCETDETHERWRPHVTLARAAADAGPPDAPAAIRWPVNECQLLRSWRAPSPPRYEVLARSRS